MNVTELRIGNYINPKINGIILTDEIHKVDPTTLMMISRQIDNRNIEFEPIPLTKEILLKCGFKYIPCPICGQDQWAGMAIWSLITPSGNYITLRGNINDIKVIYPHGTAILYLHQLQNLYFALTGQELEINL